MRTHVVNAVTLNTAGNGYVTNAICTLPAAAERARRAWHRRGATATTRPAFPATSGWDFATGIGTVNAYNLVLLRIG